MRNWIPELNFDFLVKHSCAQKKINFAPGIEKYNFALHFYRYYFGGLFLNPS